MLLTAVDQTIEGTVLQILVQSPAFDLVEHFLEFLASERLINKAFAASEPAEVAESDLEDLFVEEDQGVERLSRAPMAARDGDRGAGPEG